MRETRFVRFCAVATLVLVFAFCTAPTGASQLTLDLERTPAVENLHRVEVAFGPAGTVPLRPDGASTAAAQRVVDLQEVRAAVDWRALGAAGVASAAAPQDPDVGARGKTWSWLKRHWWVPVLVAGAVVLAVQDDTPDSGEDDD